MINRLTSVSEDGTVIAAYSYDANDNRTQTTVTGGETTSYNYNIANMLTGQITGDKLSEQYTYYLNGNQKSKVTNGQTTNYIYDSMNRLIRENDTQYSFDDFGNRLTMSDGEVTTTYSYDLNNRLTESVEENGDVTISTKFFYDNNGNQITKATMVNQPYAEGMSGDYTISKNSNNFVALYEYNCYNQLIGVDTDGVISSYAYAPDGLRHSKTVGDNTITFVYDNANVVEEITAVGTNKYYRGTEIIKNDDGLYYIYNGLGDVSILADSSGTTVANYEFDAYGNQSQENETYNPFGYRGEYTDAESGLVYLRARMYDPLTGRFINEDPIQDGLNWYVYCENNPILFVDPTGYITQEEIDLYESGKMAPMAYSHFMNLTYQWYLADDEASKEKYHQWAEDFRENDYKTTNGEFPNVDAGIEYMPSAPADSITKEQHFFRNQLNLQFSWSAFEKLNKCLPDNLKWKKLEPEQSVFHKIGQINNRKYVSACEHFEVVYTKENYLVNENFSAMNMGTYNYYGPSQYELHKNIDVAPYGKWGNTANGWIWSEAFE